MGTVRRYAFRCICTAYVIKKNRDPMDILELCFVKDALFLSVIS